MALASTSADVQTRRFRWNGEEPSSRGTLRFSNGWTIRQLVVTAAKLASQEYDDRTFTYAETVEAARKLMSQHGLAYPGSVNDDKRQRDGAQLTVDTRFGDLHREGVFIDVGPVTSTPSLFVSPEESEIEFTEGASVRVTVNSHERSTQARRACIRKYGTTCQCCGIDFAIKYGEIGKGFIHIHHLNPVATVGEGAINPVRDLRPLCPNCHAMVHRTNPPMSIEDLRVMTIRERSAVTA